MDNKQMEKEQMIRKIAEIQLFTKRIAFNETITDEKSYFEKISSVYRDISTEEVAENLEELYYISVGAIKKGTKDKIAKNSARKKRKAYELYLSECSRIDREAIKEAESDANKEVMSLNINSLDQYMEKYKNSQP